MTECSWTRTRLRYHAGKISHRSPTLQTGLLGFGARKTKYVVLEGSNMNTQVLTRALARPGQLINACQSKGSCERGPEWRYRAPQVHTIPIRTPNKFLTTNSLELSELQPSCFGRSEFQHSIKNLGGELAFDDFYSMNTQSSTQWDGLRHVCSLRRVPI